VGVGGGKGGEKGPLGGQRGRWEEKYRGGFFKKKGGGGGGSSSGFIWLKPGESGGPLGTR